MSFRKKLIKLSLLIAILYIINLFLLDLRISKTAKSIDIVDITVRNQIKVEKEVPINRTIKQQSIIDKQLNDLECDTHWEHLNREIYFKRTNQFYLIDVSQFHTFYVINSEKVIFPMRLQLQMHLWFKDVYLTNYSSPEILIDRPWSVDQYGLGSISLQLDLNNLLETKYHINLSIHLNMLNVKFHYQDLVSKRYNSKLLQLKLKYLRTPQGKKPKTSAICLKCLFLERKDYKHFSWWLKLNKRAGYDKIIMCNNSIPNTVEFKQVFKRHSNFIQVNELKCLPNFLPAFPDQYYLSKYTDLVFGLKQDVFNGLILNEVNCILIIISKKIL